MRIIGTGSALPELVVTNDMLSTFLDTSDEWISTRTGISERRVISDETIEDLALSAAKSALKMSGIKARDIDIILCSSTQPSNVTPALACYLQGELGCECPAFDISSACAGFMYALDIAEAYLQSGRYQKILLVAAENVSRMADWTKRETCILFGDGAGAVVLTQGDALKSIKLTCEYNKDVLFMSASPSNNPFLKEKQPFVYLTMDGQEVFKFAVNRASTDICEILEKAQESLDTVDYFLMHQANLRIIKAICKKLKHTMDRFLHNIERVGNTSSASLPILLDELVRAGTLKKGHKLVMSAFGAGLVAGTCLLEWQI